MKSKLFSFVLALLLFVPGILVRNADAGVHVGIGINIAPPAFVFSAPPAVVYVPGTSVYYAPEADMDILFYSGYWYRPYEGRWFRATSYNGPWVFVNGPRVPRAIVSLPPDYRSIAYGERIPYGQLHRNWRHWEKTGYWEGRGRHDMARHDMGRHKGERRRESIAERYEHRGRDRY